MDKCDDEKCLRHDIEHLGSSTTENQQEQQTLEYSASPPVNVMNSLGININPLDISRPWLNKKRWQKHKVPPEEEETSTNSTSKMHYQSSLNTKKSISSGSKRRTIYKASGLPLASTFSVFLIKCLIVATAYDDKFVNKL